MPDNTADTNQIASVENYYWSYDIPAFTLSNLEEGEKVRIIILAGELEVYRDTLYAFGGAVSVPARDIIVENMQGKGIFHSLITIMTAPDKGSETVFSFMALYSSRRVDIDPKTFATNHFLTTASVRNLPQGWSDTVSAWVKQGESTQAKTYVVYRDSEGKINTTSGIVGPPDLISTDAAIRDYTVEWPVLPEGATPISLLLKLGERSIVWYYTSRIDVVFAFDNIFGKREIFASKGSVVRKISEKGSLATINNTLSRYDAEETEEYTVTFPPSDREKLTSLEQIAAARHPRWGIVGVEGATPARFDPIVISSAELSSDDDPDSLPSPKITFRSTNVTPSVGVSASGGVFTKQFDTTFI